MFKAFRLDNVVAVPIAITVLGSLALSLPSARFNTTETETTTASMSADNYVYDRLSIPEEYSNRNFPEKSENNETLKILGITALGVGALGVVWQRKQNNKSLSFNTIVADRHQKTNTLWIDKTDPKLRKKLLRLLHNDRSTANRLIAGANISHPDRSVNWLAEKVIYDLERDRL
jgi:hypothetical protein